MLRKLLSVLSVGLLLGTAASAQSFTIEPNDTISANTTGQGNISGGVFENTLNLHANVRNNTGSAYKLYWTLLSDSTESPAGWVLTGICDNIMCRSPYSDFYYHNEQETFDVQPNQTCLMEARIYCPVSSANGTGVMRVKIRTFDNSQVDTLVFIVNKNSTGVSAIAVDDSRVAVYPNPAENGLTVYADKSLNPANIAIYNIAGAQQFATPVTKGKDITTVNINSLAKGIYMVRITDATGNILTTRKFSKR